jgi:hypothetical protein
MRCPSMMQTVSHRLPLLLPERDALIPLRHFLASTPPLVGAFSCAVVNKSFDRLRTNGKWLISFVVSLSNHTVKQLVQCFPFDQVIAIHNAAFPIRFHEIRYLPMRADAFSRT